MQWVGELRHLCLGRIEITELVLAGVVASVPVVEPAELPTARIGLEDDLPFFVPLAFHHSAVGIDDLGDEPVIIIEELPFGMVALLEPGKLFFREIGDFSPPQPVLPLGPYTAS